jgi:hypothetical protein
LQLPGKQPLSFPAMDTDHRVKRIGDSIQAVLTGQELDPICRTAINQAKSSKQELTMRTNGQ